MIPILVGDGAEVGASVEACDHGDVEGEDHGGAQDLEGKGGEGEVVDGASQTKARGEDDGEDSERAAGGGEEEGVGHGPLWQGAEKGAEDDDDADGKGGAGGSGEDEGLLVVGGVVRVPHFIPAEPLAGAGGDPHEDVEEGLVPEAVGDEGGGEGGFGGAGVEGREDDELFSAVEGVGVGIQDPGGNGAHSAHHGSGGSIIF